MSVGAVIAASSTGTHATHESEGLDSILERLNPKAKEKVLPLLKEAYPEIKIEELLGKGGFSEVYSFTYLEEGVEKRLVIKLSAGEKVKRNMRCYNLTREEVRGEWLALLNYESKHVLKTYQAIARDSEGKYVLVSDAEVQEIFENPETDATVRYTLIGTIGEYIEGATDLAKQAFSKKNVTEEEARKIIKKVLKGLAVMHKKGIAHRDIKASNILLSREGEKLTVKVADFGLSRQIVLPKEGHRRNLSNCGSHGMKAPEMLETGVYGLKVDSFSTAVTLLQTAKRTWNYLRAETKDEFKESARNPDTKKYLTSFFSGGLQPKTFAIISLLSTYDDYDRPLPEEILIDASLWK